MPWLVSASKRYAMSINCRNIESRHISINLSGCVPARPHANLYSSFLQPKQRARGSRISYKSENDATLNLSIEAGKYYFVWQEVKMDLLIARSKLSQVSEEQGRQAGVIESKLVR